MQAIGEGEHHKTKETMENFRPLYGVATLLFGLIMVVKPSVVMSGGGSGLPKCGYHTVFNFGDSNSDTGGLSAAMYEVLPPNGETFFGHPAGRFCDGRLVVDFIAERLRLPYLSPYLDSMGANFRHGANFAIAGSSVLPDGGYTPFHLGIQIAQFVQFKARTMMLYGSKKFGDNLQITRSHLPKPEDFSKALYTFDIGQNDLGHGLQNSTEEQVRMTIPDIIGQLAGAIREVHKQGARFFWVHNTGPIGCLPYSTVLGRETKELDENGCYDIAKQFNYQLKAVLSELSMQLLHSAFTYVDVYSAKYQLIGSANQQGFKDPMNFCCGSYYGNRIINCGTKAITNGTVVYGDPCDDPSRHISWDGIHYSEAANKWVATRILNGSFSYQLLPIE